MTREEAWELLGGYASGNLTPEQESALLAVALEDQELFDALMAEQPLKELLDDPSTRHELLRALDEPVRPLPWWRKPMVWALAGSLAASVATIGVLWRPMAPRSVAMVAKQTAQPEAAGTAVAPPAEPAKPAAPKPIVKREPRKEAARMEQQPPPAPAPMQSVTAEPAAPVVQPVPSPQPADTATVLAEQSEQKQADVARPAQSFRASAPPMRAMLARKAEPGLRVRLQQLQPDGAYVTVSPTAAFQARDVLRVQVASGTPAHLWLLQRNGAEWRFLLQSDDTPVNPNTPYLAPLPIAEGEQRVLVVLSRTPLTRAQVIEAAEAGPGRNAAGDNTPSVYELKFNVH